MISKALELRRAEFDNLKNTLFDVVIIGSGISGACLFHHLCSQGYRVLLVDKSDFAGGTSQSSAMMIWGGLLYLRTLDLPTAYKLSASRDKLVRNLRDCVQPRLYRYVLPVRHSGKHLLVHSALYFYWLLSGCKRTRPRRRAEFGELPMLNDKRDCFEYEEAYVPASDARFVLHWILNSRSPENPAMNHCAVQAGQFDRKERRWFVELRDSVLNRETSARARVVVNAAGAWTDAINARFGIRTSHKHALSKGVFIGVPRHASHRAPLIFERQLENDHMAFIPWGPISLWGATETPINDVTAGCTAQTEDVSILLEELNRNLSRPFGFEDIVSLRCGVRALAVPRNCSQPLDTIRLSRKFVVQQDRELPWISIHGGKLTSCREIALSASAAIQRRVSPVKRVRSAQLPSLLEPTLDSFPGLQESVVSPAWCAEREGCRTLEDYLRRRTNIAQWIPRGGLGFHNENKPHLERIASVFTGGDLPRAQAAVAAYQTKIAVEFDRIIPNRCSK